MGESADLLIFNVRGFASQEVAFVAVDATTSEVAWEYSVEGVISGQLTDAESGVTYISLRGFDEELTERMIAIDLATGNTFWPAPGGDANEAVYLDGVSPAVVMLIEVAQEPYSQRILDPATGKTAWTIELPEQTGTRSYRTQAVDEHVIVTESEDGESSMKGYTADSGEESWSAEFDGEVSGNALNTPNGTLVVSLAEDDDITLTAIDLATGETVWSADPSPLTSIRMADGNLHTVGSSGDQAEIAAFDSSTGDDVWSTTLTESNPVSIAGAVGSTVVIQSQTEDGATLIAIAAEE